MNRLSNSAFNCNLRPCSKAVMEEKVSTTNVDMVGVLHSLNPD